jgi:hypothetical protein
MQCHSSVAQKLADGSKLPVSSKASPKTAASNWQCSQGARMIACMKRIRMIATSVSIGTNRNILRTSAFVRARNFCSVVLC